MKTPLFKINLNNASVKLTSLRRTKTHCACKHYVYKQYGSVSVMMVMFLPLLVGMAALAFNYGNLAIVKTQLQTVADACAISAAKQLDGSSSQFDMARTAGALVASNNKANGVAVTPTIRFDTQLTGGFATTGSTSTANPANYKFVQCTASTTVNKVMAMMGNSASDSISVKSYGGLVPTSGACALPIAVCSNASAITGSSTKLIHGTFSSPSTFKWACFGSSCSTNVNDIETILSSENSCNIQLNNQVVKTTNASMASLTDDYNTRFGIKKNSYSGTVLPDYTGYDLTPSGADGYNSSQASTYANGYTSSQLSAYKTRRSAFTKYQYTENGNTVIQPTVSTSKSRRIVLAPVINCSGSSTQTITSRANWACILMLNPVFNGSDRLYFEYLGNGSAAACSQFRIAGGSGGPLTAALVK